VEELAPEAVDAAGQMEDQPQRGGDQAKPDDVVGDQGRTAFGRHTAFPVERREIKTPRGQRGVRLASLARGATARAVAGTWRHRSHYWPICFFSQPLTVSCHCTLLCGLSTQWFSSGKYSSCDSIPCRCRVWNVDRLWSSGTRKSFWPATTSVGTFHLWMCRAGLNAS